MDDISEILNKARQRAEEMRLPYAGALLPAEAYALMQKAPGAKLIDVRTRAEWDFVGKVPGSVMIEWHTELESSSAMAEPPLVQGHDPTPKLSVAS